MRKHMEMRAAREAQEESLRQHLTNEATARRAERHPNRCLTHAARNARQKKARQIGANDQQHHPNRTK